MVDCPPEVVRLAIDLHENFVDVPPPAAGLHTLDAAFPDLGGKLRTKAMPPISNCLVADIDTSFVQ